MKYAILVSAAILVAPVLFAQPDNVDELAKNPKFMEQDIKPKFQKVTAKQLQDGVKIVSGRSYAMFGFNVPEIQAHLPAFDNNVYATIKFSDATLLDDNGNEVAYEREDGLYTHEDLETETRFVTEDYQSLIEFAKAKGTVTVRYPSSIRTISVNANDSTAMKNAGLAADGPYVKIFDGAGIAEEASFSPIEGLRVYDASGGRLERYQGWGSGGSDETGSFRGVAYHGVPARFEADIVEEWIGLEFTYELPPAPAWPDSRSGLQPKDKFDNTASGDVTSRVVNLIPPEVLGWYADLSKEDLLEQLANYRYREFSEQNMVLAATQGEIEAVQILLAAGVTPDAEASNGRAIINAAMSGRDDVAILLIKAGADVNAVDETNSSALLRATNRCGNAELIKALIAAGADVNVQAKGSATPMMMATVMNCSENQKLLKAAGAKEWKQ